MIKLSITEKKNLIIINKIIVPQADRGKGVGGKILIGIIHKANRKNKTIALTPSKDFGGSLPRLKKFYKKYGFIENKGKNKDYEISESMYKLPGKKL